MESDKLQGRQRRGRRCVAVKAAVRSDVNPLDLIERQLYCCVQLPEFLAESFTGRTEMVYVPHLQLYRYDCIPE